tara:strand:- start:70 stop:540 length:471 start_codon:yes stop_codon:yes gene_type:complete
MQLNKKTGLKFLISSGLRRYVLLTGMNLLPFSYLRIYLLRFCGIKMDKGGYVGFNVIPDTNFPELIKIGKKVTISHNVQLITHTATPVKTFLSTKYGISKNIIIKDGAWIGAGSIVLPGTTIEENCFIGAGSVVSGKTKSFTLFAGNPCKEIKSLK